MRKTASGYLGESESTLAYSSRRIRYFCGDSRGIPGKQGTILNRKEKWKTITMLVLAWI